MFEFEFSFPTSISFGSGVVDRLGPRVAEVATSCLLMTGGASSRRNGSLDRCQRSLERAGVEVTVYDGISSNAKYQEVRSAAERGRQAGSRAVVGVGGGSVMDAARAVALASTHDGDFWDYRVTGSAGVGGIGSRTLPVFTVPTAAGTGAEVSPAALITRDGHKEVFFSPHLFPHATFVDPEPSLGLSAELSARIGVDAFIQGMEAYVSRTATPFSDAFALAAMRLSADWLPRVVADGDDLDGRANMFVAAVMSLLAVNQAGVGAIHALSNPLSGRYGLHHGLALSVLAPAVVRFNWEQRAERYRQIVALVGVDERRLEDHDGCDVAAARLRGWLASLGLGEQLSSLGVSSGDLDALARESQNPDLGTNPRPVSPAEARSIYEASM